MGALAALSLGSHPHGTAQDPAARMSPPGSTTRERVGTRVRMGERARSDDDGSSYGIGTPPRCPVCGSNRMDHWEATNPPEFVETEVPSVTHQRWKALSENEKLRELEVATSDFLSS